MRSLGRTISDTAGAVLAVLIVLALFGGLWGTIGVVFFRITGWFGLVIIAGLTWAFRAKFCCSHGLLAGHWLNRCATCAAEKHEIEQRREKEEQLNHEREQARLAERKRQEELSARAAQVRAQERNRLEANLAPNLEELRSLSPKAFEDTVARVFKRLGFNVIQTPYVNDGGRDAIMTKGGQKFLLECKRYGDGTSCGRPDVQKFYGAMRVDDASAGYFVTTGRFTQEALEYVSILGSKNIHIEAIDGEKLKRLIFSSMPAAENDDAYHSVCAACGDVVVHRLRSPTTISCRNRHPVTPMLDIETILTGRKTNEPRRARRGRRRKYRSAA